VTGVPVLSPSGLDLKDVRAQLAAAARELYLQGLLTSLGGNLSARVPDTEAAWITPSGVHKGGLVPEDMVRIDYRAKMLAGPPGLKPSVEAAVHAAVYRALPDAGAVIHAHPPHGIVVATLDLPLLPVTEEATFFTKVPRLPYLTSGSDEFAQAVAGSLQESHIVMIANHGVFARGTTLREAANDILSLEAVCRLLLLLRQHSDGREFPMVR
jgi:L-ribulose-5-phosphate 4-epimerase